MGGIYSHAAGDMTPGELTLADFRRMCREHTGEALASLIEVMRDSRAPQNTRMAAAITIIEHGYGKPKQVVGGDGDNEDVTIVHKIERLILDATPTNAYGGDPTHPHPEGLLAAPPPR